MLETILSSMNLLHKIDMDKISTSVDDFEWEVEEYNSFLEDQNNHLRPLEPCMKYTFNALNNTFKTIRNQLFPDLPLDTLRPSFRIYYDSLKEASETNYLTKQNLPLNQQFEFGISVLDYLFDKLPGKDYTEIKTIDSVKKNKTINSEILRLKYIGNKFGLEIRKSIIFSKYTRDQRSQGMHLEDFELIQENIDLIEKNIILITPFIKNKETLELCTNITRKTSTGITIGLVK